MPFLPIGGQAVIEGVMMRSPSRVAVVVRRADGSLSFLERRFVSVTRRIKALGLPVVRGAVSLFETLYLGIGALNFSADQATLDEERPRAAAKSGTAGPGAAGSMAAGAASMAGRPEAATRDAASPVPAGAAAGAVPAVGAGAGATGAAETPSGTAPVPDANLPSRAAPGRPSGMHGAIQGLTIALSLGLGILLFVVLPARVTTWLGFHDRIGFGLVDGFFRLLAFILYLLLISQWKELARVLAYHGAEHKAIHALENRAPLTPESVQSFSRLHPRCGTSFLFLVVVISIVVFTFIGRPHGIGDHLLRVACMPLIAGVAFEFIRLSGKYADRPLVRGLVWPGLQFQRLTTREPDLPMCEVAIAALERVRSDETVLALEARGVEARAEVAFVQ